MKRVLGLVIVSILCAGCQGQQTSSIQSEQTSESETSPVEIIEVDPDRFQDEIVGTYRLRSDDRQEYLNISVYCGVVLLERYDVTYDYVSVEEVYFEDSGVLEKDVNQVQGTSILYTDIIQRDQITLTLEELLTIHVRDEDTVYLRDDSITYFDREESESDEKVLSEQLTGNWMSMEDQFTFSYMQFTSEGMYTYVVKRQDLPISVFKGEWQNTDENHIQIQGSYLGEKQEQKIVTCETDAEDASLFLMNASESDFLANEEVLLLKTDENCLMPDSLYAQDFVYAYVYEEGTYTDAFDIEISYSYRIPQLNADTAAAQEINQAIQDEYMSLVMEARNDMIDKEDILTDEISYFTQEFGDVIVLVVRKTQYPFYDRYYNVYYYDRVKDRSYTKEEILNQLNLSEEDFLEKSKEQARIQYELLTEDLKEEYPDMYEEGYNRIDDYITLDMISFCPIDGGILIYCPVASLAQNPYYFHELFIQLD